ncbi:hypothetical protein BN59_01392 [Legionella massiliensis]|uniref:Phytanoyl-CoA dioxygenase (PhyH) n=1 Tax=Legionella massiliensis TaxID=1034943 RepID=A0A078KRQ9_9GAMM|nr:phytanoyl-CoA dioxygenase family protein [Legionella massiliensis]CDZ77110.1 hypothetical protein BN59_01392 [Legionella massiliensis]CEE12848.1 hypothetical protein BN1094_01392 [Legionella massiliensis]
MSLDCSIMLDFLTIFTNKKTFTGILGNPTANRCGLHIFRIVLSDAIEYLRKLPFYLLAPKAAREFNKNGILLIENFLDPQLFFAVKNEIEEHVNQLPEALPNLKKQLYGDKIQRVDGYDRYDGDTLNRFDYISRRSPVRRVFMNLRVHRLTLALFGMFNTPFRYSLYTLRHGDEEILPDSQKLTHRDTFHHTYKIWYFVQDVELSTGPFEYSVGSHISTWRRLRWEYQRSNQISSNKNLSSGGALRIGDEELIQIDIQPPKPLCVKANTMIIANTRGFHRRGFAKAGIKRAGIFGYFRPFAFFPFLQP